MFAAVRSTAGSHLEATLVPLRPALTSSASQHARCFAGIAPTSLPSTPSSSSSSYRGTGSCCSRCLTPKLPGQNLCGCSIRRTFAAQAAQDDDEGLSEMEKAVREQQSVLFPRMKELEEARYSADKMARGAGVPAEEWSPKELPYKVYERDGTTADSDEDSEEYSDSDSDVEEARSSQSISASSTSSSGPPQGWADQAPNSGKAAGASDAATSSVQEVDGVQIGIEDIGDDDGLSVGMDARIEEQGFVYKGPEPTLYGDWQHKGRATDF
eukprot:CAMPEP_0206502674 /NCGR_PEP_ID=MMETSP0324_2-20121206/54160_1 /ASSEMBLY_ACC=CAM_ASM_000836 /TAXON_ID=2866 /ORGANISM="Crypthecodinium cohnii, Strain Seligo" /LENGTH=268 /DNA_ID=CAMNT_0053990957 /DNA_START=107 /DNA_END=913 /DNA_ORIENTATION=-